MFLFTVQPKKPKRTTENKDEINAFTQLQQYAISWLQQGDHALVRAKVSQIMDVWQQKQKVKFLCFYLILVCILHEHTSSCCNIVCSHNQGIRTRRFVTALALITSPQSAANILANNRTLLVNTSAFSPRMYDAHAAGNIALSNEASGLTSLTAIADIYDPPATDVNRNGK